MEPKEGWLELHEKIEIEHLIDDVQTIGYALQKLQIELEKTERELDTVPDIDIYLAGVKRALERLTSLYYTTSLPLVWVLEDTLERLENERLSD